MKSLQTARVVLAAFLFGAVAISLFPGCGAGSNTEADTTASRAEKGLPPRSGSVSAPAKSPPNTAPNVFTTPATNVPASADRAPVMDPQANAAIEAGDWPQWGGTSYRNNTPVAKNIPTQWEIGDFDRQTGQWIPDNARNIKWVARLGSQTYGNPVVAGGRVWVGTNNGAGYVKRYPASVDLGCLLCFQESDGRFLWQNSSEKLPTGGAQDWPLQGICCAPLVEGNRLWYVTSRGEVVCLDAEGFYDGEDDGPRSTSPEDCSMIARRRPPVPMNCPPTCMKLTRSGHST